MGVPASPSGSHANEAFESMYNNLRMQAKYYLRREDNAWSMTPTVLVHEAWITLAKARGVKIVDARHYARLISRIMRNLLVDRARSRRAIANGGALQRVEWTEAAPAMWQDSETVLAVATAVEKLASHSPQLAGLVELRYFAGFTEREVAQILGISTRSVRRQWAVARLHLIEAMANGASGVRHAA